MLPNPWLILGVVIAWIASLGVVGSWQNTVGHTDERAIWQTKENAQLAAANAEIERLRKIEREGALRIAAIGDDHAQHLADLEAQHLRDLDAVRSGALRLRIPNACAPATGPSEAPGPAQGSDGATTGELPPEIARRLFDLADEADRNTLQLTACQTVIQSYLKETP